MGPLGLMGRAAAASLLLLPLLLSAGGCAFQATKIDPRPWIEGSRLPYGLVVQVEDTVPEDMLVISRDGIPDLDIKGWKTAWETGLVRGRPQRFGEPGTGPDFQLVLHEAELELVVVSYRPDGGVETFLAKVTYKAQLFDPDRRPVKEVFGTAWSRQPFTGISDGSGLLGDVIARAVEEIIQKTAAQAEGTPTPGQKAAPGQKDAPAESPPAAH